MEAMRLKSHSGSSLIRTQRTRMRTRNITTWTRTQSWTRTKWTRLHHRCLLNWRQRLLDSKCVLPSHHWLISSATFVTDYSVYVCRTNTLQYTWLKTENRNNATAFVPATGHLQFNTIFCFYRVWTNKRAKLCCSVTASLFRYYKIVVCDYRFHI